MNAHKLPYPKPTVSVVLPTYNRAAYITRAINSVLEQSYPNFDLLVIDDGSCDETAEIVATIDDPRLRLIRLPANRGAAAARNLGIQESQAGLIAFLDSDDIWAADKLEAQIVCLRQSGQKTGVVYTSFHWRRGEQQSITPSNIRVILSRSPLARHKLSGELWAALLHGNFITTSTVLIKRECLEETGGFDEGLRRLQDWDLWLRISQNYQFSYINRPLVETSAPAGRISTQHGALVAAFDLILDKHRQDGHARRLLTACRNYALGELFLDDKQAGQARLQFWLALRADPLTAAYWLAFLTSLAGSKFYRRFRKSGY